MKIIGFDQPLFILPFDHRGSFETKMFGWHGDLKPAQTAEIASAKQVIDDGFKAAIAAGVRQEKAGILVDQQFGGAILRDACSNGHHTACPAEKSGQHEFDFEYGADFAEQAQLDRFHGDKKAYNLELRPKLMVQALYQLQELFKTVLERYKQNLLSKHSSPRLALLLLVAVLFHTTSCRKEEQKPQPGPPDVLVTEVTEKNVPVFQEAVATLSGPVNADITPKVQGYLLKQNYENGTFVKKDQLLFEIDPRPFIASLEQAKAEVARAQANLERTNNDVIRDTPLAAQNAIPQRQLQNDQSAQAAAKAQVAAMQAAQQQAELNLGWTKVLSPVDGIAGVSNSQIGDLVGTSTKMTVVSQVDPIWAYFYVSESAYLASAPEITRLLRTGEVNVQIPVEFIQANEEPYPVKGKIIFINRQVTAGTGTIQFAAAFRNKDAILRPGGFGRVRLLTKINQSALLVPQQAVIQVQTEYQLVVLSADNRAHFRPVKVGERVGTDWIITEGVKPGEKVVVEGYLKVLQAAGQNPELAREGVPVAAKPYVPPSGARASN